MSPINDPAGAIRQLVATGRLEAAVELGKEALAGKRKMGPVALGQLWLSLSLAYERLGVYQEAAKLSQEALVSFQAGGDRIGLRNATVQQARALVVLGDFDEAENLINGVLGVLPETLPPGERAAFYLEAARVLVAYPADPERPTLSRAEWLARNALRLVESTGIDRIVMIASAILAQIHLARGERARAMVCARRAADLLEEIGGNDQQKLRIWFTQAQTLRALGDSRAFAILAQARSVLARRACTIVRHEFRRAYLNRPLHRAIRQHSTP